MSHWAELDENNKVIRVLVGDNNDANGDEGYQWLLDNLGGTWIKTSYNGNIRYNYAGIGYTYDAIDDAFIAPIPTCGHDELLLNNLKRWECSNAEHNIKKL
jgi:hypothetical protein